MIRKFPIYKGLQKPLVYKGFQGKFIAWGIGSLVIGLVFGGLLGAFTNLYIGGLVLIIVTICGFYYTSLQQKKGLHNKTRHVGVFQFATNLNPNNYGQKKKDRV